METTLLKPTALNRTTRLPEVNAVPENPKLENNEKDSLTPYRLGPEFYSGRSPFKIRVMILTCFAIPEESAANTGSYITYVGYKKDVDHEFDFDEMIPSTSPENALNTHTKACGFFGNSPLFLKSAI